MMDDDIHFDVRGQIGLVTLDRPRALNALTLEMIAAFEPRLATWAADGAIAAVLVRGAGDRAFCAGGDVRSIWQNAQQGGALAAEFFRAEYRLIRAVKVFPKPYIAAIDGIVMGGGVGVSVHGSHRIATERLQFAMPETGIGLFPDVGATYLLPRLPGALGVYLGLTGARLGAADAVYCGLATHFVRAENLPDLEAALAAASWPGTRDGACADAIIAPFAADPGPAPLAVRRTEIDRCFAQDSLDDILAALRAERSDWGRDILATLAARSPTSLMITFEALRRGATLTFDAAVIMEYRLSQACAARHDFHEGVRAALIDKDNAPRWRPGSLGSVTPDLVAAHFQTLGARDLTFE
jgi:enoyl-CoA hydratase